MGKLYTDSILQWLDGEDSDNDGEDEQGGDSTSKQSLFDEARQGVGVSADAEILADAQLRAGVNEDDMTKNPDDAVKKRKVKPRTRYRSTCPYIPIALLTDSDTLAPVR